MQLVVYRLVLLDKCFMRERKKRKDTAGTHRDAKRTVLLLGAIEYIWEDRTAVESEARPRANVGAR